MTGEGGFLPELIKAVLKRGMKAELRDHLGYDKHDRVGYGSGNSRNGTTAKTVHTEVGPVKIDQPRDRAGSFKSCLLPPGQQRLAGLDDMIISLYAGGMTVRKLVITWRPLSEPRFLTRRSRISPMLSKTR